MSSWIISINFQSISDIITNSSSELFVFKENKFRNILKSIPDIHEPILFNYDDWKNNIYKSPLHEIIYKKISNIFYIETEETREKLEFCYLWGNIAYEKPNPDFYIMTKNGSGSLISGKSEYIDRFKEYVFKNNNKQKPKTLVKNFCKIEHIPFRELLKATPYQVMIEDLDGKYLIYGDNNRFSCEEINKILEITNGTRYFG